MSRKKKPAPKAKSAESTAAKKTLPTKEDNFNAATLRVCVAIGTVDLVIQYCEEQDYACKQHFTISRAMVETLYGALYHLRDAEDLLAGVPHRSSQT